MRRVELDSNRQSAFVGFTVKEKRNQFKFALTRVGRIRIVRNEIGEIELVRNDIAQFSRIVYSYNLHSLITE